MIVTVSPEGGKWVPTGTQADIAKFFNGSTPGVGLSIKTSEGAPLLEMHGWQMSVPNHKDGNADILYDRRTSRSTLLSGGRKLCRTAATSTTTGSDKIRKAISTVAATFVRCAHDYNAAAGQSVCVPFVVTNKGYGLAVGQPLARRRCSLRIQRLKHSGLRCWPARLVLRHRRKDTYDEIYQGYRLLTGDVPMLPKSAYGYIQCKQRYTSQEELWPSRKGYRDRHLPIDDAGHRLVPLHEDGPDGHGPSEVAGSYGHEQQLHAMNFHTMISVWPRFVPEDRYYATCLKNGWFEQLADGTPTNGLPYDRAGSDIDTTNPDAARWYWNIIQENYISKGFDSFWADETEPDLPPEWKLLPYRPRHEYFNVYPALPHRGVLQRLSPRPDDPRPHSRSRLIPRRPA